MVIATIDTWPESYWSTAVKILALSKDLKKFLGGNDAGIKPKSE